MTCWVLTIILIGTTIEFQEGKPQPTLELCKKEGFRVVRDYQEGGIRAKFECEERHDNLSPKDASGTNTETEEYQDISIAPTAGKGV